MNTTNACCLATQAKTTLTSFLPQSTSKLLQLFHETTLAAGPLRLDPVQRGHMLKELRHESTMVLISLADELLHNQRQRLLRPDLQNQRPQRRLPGRVVPNGLNAADARRCLISRSHKIIKDRIAESRVVQNVTQDVKLGQVECGGFADGEAGIDDAGVQPLDVAFEDIWVHFGG